jgi:hypothetical protein
LTDRGDLDEAAQILRARADAGEEAAARRLPNLLIKQGRGEEAERWPSRWHAISTRERTLDGLAAAGHRVLSTSQVCCGSSE